MPVLTTTAKTPLTTARILEVDGDHAKATLGNMLLIVWSGATLAPAYGRVADAVLELGKQFSTGVGVLQTVEHGASPPSAEARAEFSRVLAACNKHVRHFSVVHEGNGFKAASVRAIMSGVYLLARPAFPHIVSSSLQEAAAWHVSHHIRRSPGALEVEDILLGVRALRVRLGVQPR